jgi:hypothetical protein
MPITIGYHCTMQGNIDAMQKAVFDAIKRLSIKTNDEALTMLDKIATVAIENDKGDFVTMELPFKHFIIGDALHFVSYRVIEYALKGRYTFENAGLHMAVMEYKA